MPKFSLKGVDFNALIKFFTSVPTEFIVAILHRRAAMKNMTVDQLISESTATWDAAQSAVDRLKADNA